MDSTIPALRGPVEADPYAKYRFVGNAFAFVILVASVAEFVWNARDPTSRDFISFWGAAQFALAGNPSAAYDNAALHAVQSAVASFGNSRQEMPFPYPPAYLLLVMPFGLLSFATAMAAWTVSTFGIYVAAARRLMPRSGWLTAAFPAVFANAALGQNGFLTAGIFMGGLSLLRRRPFTAGMLLGCLVIKPQLGLLLPVALIGGRAWRAVAGAALSSILILLVGVIAFGVPTTAAWLHELPLYAAITRDGLVGWSKLASIYAAGRQYGLGPIAALALHSVVAVGAGVATWRIWRSTDETGVRVAILSAATALASPYLFFYDGLILVPAFMFLARAGERPALLLAIWCLPLLQLAQIGSFDTLINLNVIAAILLCALIYLAWHKGNSGQPHSDSVPLKGLATLGFNSSITS
jgi:hypothetical protein